tara:strand:+ start:215 stop:661 length:447 start_codon:yes stop_codon:yes gene_type:complete
MFPITELRISIPYFIIVEKLSWIKVFLFSIAGNIFIGIFVRYIISPLMLVFKKNSYLDKIITYILERTYTSSEKIKQYKTAGLILFIGIPLPFTGVWTGALAAYLLSISKFYSFLGILFGVIISGIIVTLISLTGLSISEFLIKIFCI